MMDPQTALNQAEQLTLVAQHLDDMNKPLRARQAERVAERYYVEAGLDEEWAHVDRDDVCLNPQMDQLYTWILPSGQIEITDSEDEDAACDGIRCSPGDLVEPQR